MIQENNRVRGPLKPRPKKKKKGNLENGAEKPVDNSPKVPQRPKLSFNLAIETLPLNEKQKAFMELALHKDTNVIFVDGPAGTAKTYLAVLAGLQMLNSKRHSDIIYVRNLVEASKKGMGFLPGEAHEKFAPYLQPLVDKLEEFLSKPQIEQLKKEDRIQGKPLAFLRGASFNAVTFISDETQNMDVEETITEITRIGKFSKFFFLGDSGQSDLHHGDKARRSENGFAKVAAALDNEACKAKGIFYVKFTKEDIVRSEILKFIIGQLEEAGLL